MSEILKGLIGKKCTVVSGLGLTEIRECTIVAVDDEWMQMSFYDKKGNAQTSIKRIEDIEEIKDIEELNS